MTTAGSALRPSAERANPTVLAITSADGRRFRHLQRTLHATGTDTDEEVAEARRVEIDREMGAVATRILRKPTVSEGDIAEKILVAAEYALDKDLRRARDVVAAAQHEDMDLRQMGDCALAHLVTAVGGEAELAPGANVDPDAMATEILEAINNSPRTPTRERIAEIIRGHSRKHLGLSSEAIRFLKVQRGLEPHRRAWWDAKQRDALGAFTHEDDDKIDAWATELGKLAEIMVSKPTATLADAVEKALVATEFLFDAPAYVDGALEQDGGGFSLGEIAVAHLLRMIFEQANLRVVDPAVSEMGGCNV